MIVKAIECAEEPRLVMSNNLRRGQLLPPPLRDLTVVYETLAVSLVGTLRKEKPGRRAIPLVPARESSLMMDVERVPGSTPTRIYQL